MDRCKAELTSFDRLGLLGLIQDLYAAHKDNQTFLHARFGLGADVLKPYKETLDRWLWPDVLRNQDTSVVKARQAISSYRKAVGEPAGLAELMVFYCERAAGFCSDLGYQDDGYFNALVRMFDRPSSSSPSYLPATACPNRPAGSSTHRQPQLRLRGRRRYGFHACEIRERLTRSAAVRETEPPRYASVPKAHDRSWQLSDCSTMGDVWLWVRPCYRVATVVVVGAAGATWAQFARTAREPMRIRHRGVKSGYRVNHGLATQRRQDHPSRRSGSQHAPDSRHDPRRCHHSRPNGGRQAVGRHRWLFSLMLRPALTTTASSKPSYTSFAAELVCDGETTWNSAVKQEPGDFIYVPPYVPHQEINALADEPCEAVVVRSGQDPIVVNLDIESPEPTCGGRGATPFHPTIRNP